MLGGLSFYVEYAAVAASVCFLLSPLVEVQKVHRSQGKALRDVCPSNLLLMLVNSALWLWYAIFVPLPPMVVSNTIGLTAGCYCLTSCWFYARQCREQTWGTAAAASTVLAFMAIFLALVYAATSFSHVQQLGYLAMAVNILAYGAPLAVVSRVLVEKCSRALPPAQCILALSCSFLWLCVGLTAQSMPLILPNACGVLLAILQLFLIWFYPRRDRDESLSSQGLGRTLLATSQSGKKQGRLENVKPAPGTWEIQYMQSLRHSRQSSRHGSTSTGLPKPKPMLLVGICTDAD
ncbi:swt-1 [Symbiodinium necroappetens]|uniref:Swt-1 protein n=1 Tax=Symbiodinium necroappetens TaxID=1628268 RepID=A0A812NJB5_9DINO|nr:swt-1 [Symbiodinium necroappetens]|mmetsp:Transcript_5856/g.13729  ORF Transcript_5856/g.13729 Transcript_5856/m.13729 type:complete len:292 (-) Transcript_5856:185-1060(-)|eukprot:CAMPEP_0181423402 /NCGR_PEP_ID=MMETSP1110-20121109/14110_1 /TAXON_ID=174948 /ORGANISM="Symbiodinium sp., Strain CCMP421" /LENGTH=291 /DNA_ID=CAMNT_0023546527 /DNA_START=14 /DNA_END=889 /DNA_ORIENTATION=-